MAKTLVNAMVQPFRPEQYKDEYKAKLWDVINRKIQGKEIVTPDEHIQVNVMHNNIYAWYADAEEAKLWKPLMDHIILEKENSTMSVNSNNPFVGKTVVATGKLENYTRDGIQNKLLSLGAIPASSVTKKTDFVIVGENAGSKLAKATSLGIRTLTETEFEAMLSE